MDELKKLVEEYNTLLDKVSAKWDAIYDEIECHVPTVKCDDIGSMIAYSMDCSNHDPYEQLIIDYEKLVKEMKNEN